jgi:ketosteroid isomerase-like protein
MTTKKLLTFTLTVVIAIQFGCNNKTENSNASASVEVLGQMNRDFAKALNARDAVAAASVYDENASILPPNEKIVTGRANIQKYWQGLIDAGLIDGAVKTIDAKSDGKLGYEIGTYLLHLKGPKGDTIVDKGKYTEVLKLDSASGK